MAKGYWVVSIDVTDPDRFARYVEAVTPFLMEQGATYQVRAGRHEVVEGARRGVNVVVEFPDYASALACYRSPGYQQIALDRLASSTGDFLIVEGVA